MEEKPDDLEEKEEMVEELEKEVEGLESEFDQLREHGGKTEKEKKVENILKKVHKQLDFLKEVSEEADKDF